MVIGVDLDEVLCDFTGGFLDFVNRKFGTNYSRKDMTHYSYEESGVIPKGTNKKYVREFGIAGGLRYLKPIPGAIEAIKALSLNHKIVFITSRDTEFTSDTVENVKSFGFENPEIYFASSENPKSEFVKALKVDVFIDDSPRFAADVFNNTDAVMILFTQVPHVVANSDGKCHMLASDWGTIVDSIELIQSSL